MDHIFRCRGWLRSIPAICIIALLIITQTGCSSTSAAEPVSGDNYLLDTICTISIYSMRGADGEVMPASDMEDEAQAAIDDAFRLCAELDKTLSRTVETSDVSRINEARGEWTEVDSRTAELIEAGRKYSELADGGFDITVGGVTSLWDFHADPEDARLPDPDELAEAVSHVGYEAIEIDGNKIRLKDPDARLDLGGIAKGYIGDRMTDLLEEAGVTSGIINLGGNVICIGGKTDEDDFVIGVEAPFSDRTEIVGRIQARDMTLVTSGIYERKIEVDGKLYHHILDTKTGMSAETDLDAVTLCAARGKSMDIDALSTICLIKGSQAAKEFIEGIDGVEAVFVLHDGTIITTDGVPFEKE